MHVRIAVAGLAAVALVGCGGGSVAGSSCAVASPSPPGPATVGAGPLTANADRPVLQAGETLHLRVTATGPVALTAPCDGPLQLLVVADPGDLHVYTAAPAAARGVPCGSIQLGAGQRAEYDVDWPADETLPGGVYRALLTLGDQPPLILRVAVGASPVVSSCSS